jgi:predicted nucleic acid-binding protein
VNFFLRSRDQKNLNINELQDVSQEINNFFVDHKFIVFGNITEDVWNDVKLIVEKSNLHYSDALHLAMARMWTCHLLVTHDQFFIKEGNRLLK